MCVRGACARPREGTRSERVCFTRTRNAVRTRDARWATPDGQQSTRNRRSRDGAPTGRVLVHVRTTTGQGENRQRNQVEKFEVVHPLGRRWQPNGNPTRPSAQHQQSGPTLAREHSCVWRFFTIPLTPPVLCVTVWDRRKLALWVWRASAAFYINPLNNELTVRRAHPVCLQLDRSPDPGRQGRACKKSRFGTSSKRPDTCFRPILG